MLSLLKRKPRHVAIIGEQAARRPKRKQQQNIKVSADCAAAFRQLAEVQGISRAALFEDMVAERFEALRR